MLNRRPWLWTLATVFAYDAYLIRRHGDSLSQHFALAARREPLVVSAAVAYLLAHLYGVLPVEADAFRLAGFTAAEKTGRKNRPKVLDRSSA